MDAVHTIQSVLDEWPSVRLAVLFGSMARGEARSHSDIDLGVSLADAIDIGALEVALGRATGRRIDLVDLDTAPPLLRFEIARGGHLLVERAPHAWADFKARAMIDWWDWAPTARRIHQIALERLRAQVNSGSA